LSEYPRSGWMKPLEALTIDQRATGTNEKHFRKKSE